MEGGLLVHTLAGLAVAHNLNLLSTVGQSFNLFPTLYICQILSLSRSINKLSVTITVLQLIINNAAQHIIHSHRFNPSKINKPHSK